MRIAVISDIHGNWTALEAVIADLRAMAPDVVLHGGDLADSGSSPVEVFDRVRELGWRGVLGNTDEMLIRPAALEEFAGQSKAPAALWERVREIAAATRAGAGRGTSGVDAGIASCCCDAGICFGSCAARGLLAGTGGGCFRCGTGKDLWAAGSACGGVWPHASAVDSEADRGGHSYW